MTYKDREDVEYRSLLLFRWTLFNALIFVLVGALALNGYIWPIFEHDASHLTYAIVVLFAIGWGYAGWEVLDLSSRLNRSKASGYRAASTAEGEKALLKVEWLGNVSEWLVGLGLLGTVIGFSHALSGIDQGSVSGASGAQDAVGALMQGMRVALNTTLLGAGLAIWHEVNMRMLRTAIGCYWISRVMVNEGKMQERSRD